MALCEILFHSGSSVPRETWDRVPMGLLIAGFFPVTAYVRTKYCQVLLFSFHDFKALISKNGRINLIGLQKTLVITSFRD
jgi:hypothetical protein